MTSRLCRTGAGRLPQLWLPLLTLAVLALFQPSSLYAQSCSALIDPTVDDTATPAPYFVGSTVRVSIQIGVLTVQGGSQLNVEQVEHALDCTSAGGSTVASCTDATNKVAFQGNISTDCPGITTFNATHSPGDTSPNIVAFTPDAALNIPASNTCNLSFDVSIEESPAADDTPNTIEGASRVEGMCDNALDGSADGQIAINVDVCRVSLDKQVECTGTYWDTTAGDDDPNFDQTNGCIAAHDDDVSGKAVLTNSGSATVTCDLSDGGSPVETAIPSGDPTEVELFSGLCSDEGNNGKDTATISGCTCEDGSGMVVSALVVNSTDSAQVECCGLDMDKQLTCVDPFGDGDPELVDVAFTTDNEGGATDPPGNTESCQSILDGVIEIDHLGRNLGTVDLVSCALDDVNGSGILFTENIGTIGAGATVPSAGFSAACTNDFENHEPNTATLACSCDTSGFDEGVAKENLGEQSGFDLASVECINPALMTRKSCVDSTVEGMHDVAVWAENTGDVDLVNCHVVDVLVDDNAGSGVSCDQIPPNTGFNETILSDENGSTIGCQNDFGLSVGGGEMQVCDGMTGSPTMDACNTAKVVCNIGAVDGPVIESNLTEAACEVQPGGCFTRTPGYWMQHPNQVEQVLNGNENFDGSGPINNCGLTLADADPDPNDSFPQDLCSIGKDHTTLGHSNQQYNLIRHCAAAKLNVAVSAEAGLSCDGTFPNILGVINGCCDVACADAPEEGPVDFKVMVGNEMVSCIEYITDFNESETEDDDFSAVGLINTSADPSACQAASGDGKVNEGPGRNYTQVKAPKPPKPCKGKKCP